jgi:hypothetical protein
MRFTIGSEVLFQLGTAREIIVDRTQLNPVEEVAFQNVFLNWFSEIRNRTRRNGTMRQSHAAGDEVLPSSLTHAYQLFAPTMLPHALAG